MLTFSEDTVGGNLIRAAEKLKKSGIREGRSEAEIIMAYILDLKRWRLYLQKDDTITPEKQQKYWQAVEKRAERCPLAYITGLKEFFGYEFFVSPHVLIPRPETEFLIQAVISQTKKFKTDNIPKLQILDLGTGSGAIAVTLALLLPFAEIDAVDISRNALTIAQKNAHLHKVASRIKFFEGDFGDAVKEENKKYDFIVSNPPYIISSQIEKLSPEIRKYEPLKALDGGEDGLDAYRKIITEAPFYLADRGVLVLETGEDTLKGIMELIYERKFTDVESVKDYRGHDRVVAARNTQQATPTKN